MAREIVSRFLPDLGTACGIVAVLCMVAAASPLGFVVASDVIGWGSSSLGIVVGLASPVLAAALLLVVDAAGAGRGC